MIPTAGGMAFALNFTRGMRKGDLEVGEKKYCDLKAFSFGKLKNSLDQILQCWESFS